MSIYSPTNDVKNITMNLIYYCFIIIVDPKMDNNVYGRLRMEEMKIVWSPHQSKNIYDATDHHSENIHFN